MKIAIIDKTGKKLGDIETSFDTDIREDIFKRAVLAESSIFFQKKGSDPQAGKKHSISLSKRRRNFRTTYGRGEARSPRKTMWARGRQMRWVGAFAPNTVGGRRAHPPKAEKNQLKGINNKEWLLALRVGLTSSFTNKLVKANGQMVPASYPFILDSSVEKLTKTKEVKDMLDKQGFTAELERIEVRKVRSGRGTMRSRTYTEKRGPLMVVSSIEAPLLKAARNVKGLDVITPDLLMVSDFGMSQKPGRAVLITKTALDEIKEVLN